MTFFRRRRIGSLGIALVWLLHQSPTLVYAQQPATSATWLYDLVQFDLPDVHSTSLRGINNQNEVVGSTYDGGLLVRTFLVSGGVLSFPELPDGAFPEDVNDLGQIVGFLQGSAGPYGFLYSSGTWQFVGPPSLVTSSPAHGINNYGNIVGSYTNSFPCEICLDPFGAYFTDITDPSRSYTKPRFSYEGVNDAGDIVGNGPDGAFWRSGGVDTPISVPGVLSFTPKDINNVDTVVGDYADGDTTHGFVLSNGRYVSIEFPGASTTHVEGVNDAGVIVGIFSSGGAGHGFVGIPRSPVDVTINGADGPVTIDPGQPLQVHLQFTAPPDGALNPAEVYIGVVSPVGVLWLDPATGTFGQTPTQTFAGELPSFGPVPLVNLPDGAGLPSATWTWFMIVDDDANGTIEGAFYDVAQMIVP